MLWMETFQRFDLSVLWECSGLFRPFRVPEWVHNVPGMFPEQKENLGFLGDFDKIPENVSDFGEIANLHSYGYLRGSKHFQKMFKEFRRFARIHKISRCFRYQASKYTVWHKNDWDSPTSWRFLVISQCSRLLEDFARFSKILGKLWDFPNFQWILRFYSFPKLTTSQRISKSQWFSKIFEDSK